MQSFSSLNGKKIPFIFGMIASILIACVLLLLLIVSLRIKSLRKKPFNQLHEIGFVPRFIGADTLFSFTEEMLETTINGYRVQFNVNRDTPKKVEFIFFVEAADLSKERYTRLKYMFKKENVFFDFYGLIKKYDLRTISNLTIDQVEKELIHVVEQLMAEGFEPRWN